VRSSRFRFEARGAYSPAQRVGEGVGVDVGLAAAGARACRALLGEALELSLCAGADAGSMRGNGFGVTDPASGSALWWAASAGPALTWEVSERVALYAEAAGQLAGARPSFVIDGVGEVYKVPIFGANAALGLEVRF
jgi:hypothetical protein